MPKRIEEFRHKSATALLVIDGRQATLSHVYSQIRNQGHATELLKEVCKYADEHDIRIFLKVRAYGKPTHTILNNEQLISFYKKFGFVEVAPRNGFPGMARPRRKNSPYSEREN